MEDALEIRKKRIRYQSWHRGCKETDVILGHFCDLYLDGMSEAELDDFEAVLSEEDADIFRWLTGEREVPAHLQSNPMLTRLRTFDVEPHLTAHGAK